MKFKPHDFFKKHPELEEIAIRLDDSEKEAKEKNEGISKKKTNSNNPDEVQQAEKKVFIYRPECGVISNYCKDGRWEQTPYTPKSGRDPFLKDLAKILETRDPDAIKVEIYKGKAKKTGPVYSKDIYLVTNAEIKENTSELGTTENFETSIEKIRSTVKPNNYEIELLRKDFDARLKEQEHTSEIKELKLVHQNELSELKAAVTERDEIIEELEEDLDEYEGTLSGLQQEKEPALGEIVLGKVLMRAGENLLRSNPSILKIGLGITDEEVKNIWKDSPKRIEDGQSSDNSSFSEASFTNDLKGLDPKHAEGITRLITFYKQVKTDEFRKLYAIGFILQDPKTGRLNTELADKVLQFISKNQPVETEKTT
jgi:hypothetical protein